MTLKSDKISVSKNPIMIGVVTGVIVALCAPLVQDLYRYCRDSVTNKAYIYFDSARLAKDKSYFYKTYEFKIVNYAVPYRSPAKLIIYDIARSIVRVETNDVISPSNVPNTQAHVINLEKSPKNRLTVDILMPPPRVSSTFWVRVRTKKEDSTDSTLHIKLIHDAGLYDLKMPKLNWK